MKALLFIGLCAFTLTCVVYGQNRSPEEKACNMKTNCDDCIEGKNGSVTVDCYWCSKPSNRSAPKCREYTFNSAIPVDGIDCEELQYNVGTCRINALVIVILITLACLVAVVIICCVACCCCFFFARRRQQKRLMEDEIHLEKKEQIREKYNEKRLERKSKHDEIRKKYGLKTDDDDEEGS